MILDLREGLVDTNLYKSWKFPGGEIHFKLKEDILDSPALIRTSIKSSDDLILLCLAIEALNFKNIHPRVSIDYMAYQQADRRFGDNECFSLKMIANILNSFKTDSFVIFDPHSDVSSALLNNCEVCDNSGFIKDVLYNQLAVGPGFPDVDRLQDLIILSPDAGAYKKIFALCEKIGFKGQIECCAKSRNHQTGEKTIIVPKFDETKDVLIIDDICLAGGTFLGIANQIKNKCYLAVSHGIFNNGVDHLLERFETIYTTDSRCEIDNKRVKIFNL
jgi:ribose-phosphate pyrophosphokinase